MKLSKRFEQIVSDISLISQSSQLHFDAEIKMAMEKNGWEAQKVKSPCCIARANMVFTHYVDDIIYHKGENVQGDDRWYTDLAHALEKKCEPGILTKILG